MTHTSIVIAVSILGTAMAFPAAADDNHMHYAMNETKAAVAASTAWAEGEVRKIDEVAGKLTIKHGAIPKFDMPPMTMAYRVKDKAMLEHLKLGDKVKFDVDSAGGVFTVLRLERVK